MNDLNLCSGNDGMQNVKISGGRSSAGSVNPNMLRKTSLLKKTVLSVAPSLAVVRKKHCSLPVQTTGSPKTGHRISVASPAQLLDIHQQGNSR